MTPSASKPDPEGCVQCNQNVQFSGRQEYGEKRCVIIEASGLVEFYFESYVNPDRFIVEYEGKIIGDTGFIGLRNDITYNGRRSSGFGVGGSARNAFNGGLIGKIEPVANQPYPNSNRDIDVDRYPYVRENSYTPEKINNLTMPLVEVAETNKCEFCNYLTPQQIATRTCRGNDRSFSNQLGLPADKCGVIKFLKNGASNKFYVYPYGPEANTAWFFRLKCPQPYECDKTVYPNNELNCYYSTYSISGATNIGLVNFNAVSPEEPTRFYVRNNLKQLVIDTGYIGNLKYNYLGASRSLFISSLNGLEDPFIKEDYPITFNSNNPKHKKIAPDGYPFVYSKNQFEEYFYSNNTDVVNSIVAYVDVFNPMCRSDKNFNWNFIVGCPCLIDCFEPDNPQPSLPPPPSGSVPGQSKTPTPTKTPSPTRTPTNTIGLSPTPTRTVIPPNDCLKCGTELYVGTQKYPEIVCFNIGTSIGTTFALDIDTVRYPDRYIVVFDDQIVIDTGYVGLGDYGIGGNLRTEFNKSLITRIDPITGTLIYPNSSIYDVDSDSFPVVYEGPSRFTFVKNSETSIVYVKIYAPMPSTQWKFSLNCPDDSGEGGGGGGEPKVSKTPAPTQTVQPTLTPTATKISQCKLFNVKLDLNGNNDCAFLCNLTNNISIFGKYDTFNDNIGTQYYKNQQFCNANNNDTIQWGSIRKFVLDDVCYEIDANGVLIGKSYCSGEPFDECNYFPVIFDLTKRNNCSDICNLKNFTGWVWSKRLKFNGNIGSQYYKEKALCSTNNTDKSNWEGFNVFVYDKVCYEIDDTGKIKNSKKCLDVDVSVTPTISVTKTPGLPPSLTPSPTLTISFTPSLSASKGIASPCSTYDEIIFKKVKLVSELDAVYSLAKSENKNVLLYYCGEITNSSGNSCNLSNSRFIRNKKIADCFNCNYVPVYLEDSSPAFSYVLDKYDSKLPYGIQAPAFILTDLNKNFINYFSPDFTDADTDKLLSFCASGKVPEPPCNSYDEMLFQEIEEESEWLSLVEKAKQTKKNILLLLTNPRTCSFCKSFLESGQVDKRMSDCYNCNYILVQPMHPSPLYSKLAKQYTFNSELNAVQPTFLFIKNSGEVLDKKVGWPLSDEPNRIETAIIQMLNKCNSFKFSGLPVLSYGYDCPCTDSVIGGTYTTISECLNACDSIKQDKQSYIIGVSPTGVHEIYFNVFINGLTKVNRLMTLPYNKYTDITISNNKLWVSSILNNSIDEYNITLSPWSYSYSRTINVSNNLAIGNGMAYKSSNTLISGNQGIYEIDITTNNGIGSLLFMLPRNGQNIVSEVNGDIYYNVDTDSYIVIYNTIYRDSGLVEHYVGEFTSSGSLLNRATLSSPDFVSIFSQNKIIYIVSLSNEIYRLTPTFDLLYINEIENIGIYGISSLDNGVPNVPLPTTTPTLTLIPTNTPTKTITPTKSVTKTINPTPTSTPTITPTQTLTLSLTPIVTITPTITSTSRTLSPLCEACRPIGNWFQYNKECC